jgi:hypothetical protein
MRAAQEHGFPYLIIGAGWWSARVEEYFGVDKTRRGGDPHEPAGRKNDPRIGRGASLPGLELSIVQLDDTMLKAINFLILIIWLVGFVNGHTLGGLLHLLLLLAVIVLYIQYLERHKPS